MPNEKARVIPPMPSVSPRARHWQTDEDGNLRDVLYVDSLESQARNNWPAVEWFLNNHEAVGEAVKVYNAVRSAR